MDAYEIRLELLKLAQSIENDRVWTERNRLEQDWHANKENHILNPYPKLPGVTYVDVVRVAEELNKFVSNNKKEQ